MSSIKHEERMPRGLVSGSVGDFQPGTAGSGHEAAERESMVSTESSGGDYAFDIMKIRLGSRNRCPRDEDFEKAFHLRTKEGKYNLLAELLADRNSVSIQVFIYDRTSIVGRMEFGFQTLLQAYEDLRHYCRALNRCYIDERTSPREFKHMFDEPAFEEALANAFVHNAWALGKVPSIHWHPDRMEIISWGGLKEGLSKEDFLNGTKDPANKELYDAFRLCGLLPESGGVPRILKAIGEEAFSFQGFEVKVTIPFDKSGFKQRKGVHANLACAKERLTTLIYCQAVLEGIGACYAQIEEILIDGSAAGVTRNDSRKITNLRRAWEFILDEDLMSYPSDFAVLCRIADIVNDGFYERGGRLRNIPVSITGTAYVPPLPFEVDVKEKISEITSREARSIDIAIALCLFAMRSQLFLDGNKRAAVIFANHYLISHGGGLLAIPDGKVEELRKLLVAYYETDSDKEIAAFLEKNCWLAIQA